MRVSLKSVSGVDSVEVSLEKGLASVRMKPGNTATLKQINGAISKNGSMLQVSGSNEMLELVPDSAATPVATTLMGKSVLVEAIIPEAGKGKSPDSIRYRSIKEDNNSK
ncbi:MAG: hypothetical protein DMG80_08450 [Acidobacteria bacterium]|nr:MAG: hypothetical protein DMG80_08450 [Acidobacteriota bacterium]